MITQSRFGQRDSRAADLFQRGFQLGRTQHHVFVVLVAAAVIESDALLVCIFLSRRCASHHRDGDRVAHTNRDLIEGAVLDEAGSVGGKCVHVARSFSAEGRSCRVPNAARNGRRCSASRYVHALSPRLTWP